MAKASIDPEQRPGGSPTPSSSGATPTATAKSPAPPSGAASPSTNAAPANKSPGGPSPRPTTPPVAGSAPTMPPRPAGAVPAGPAPASPPSAAQPALRTPPPRPPAQPGSNIPAPSAAPTESLNISRLGKPAAPEPLKISEDSSILQTPAPPVLASEPPDDLNELARERRGRLTAWGVIAAVLLAHAPLFVLHARDMWANPQYEYFPLIPLGGFALVWSLVEGRGSLQAGRPLRTAVGAACGFLLLTAAIVYFSPWLAMVSLLFMLLVAAYALGGSRLAGPLLPVWFFLWFMVPLPFDWDQQLVTSLQRLTAQWSSKLLDFFGVLHLMSGNTVEIPGKRLFVEEACSGVQSLFACMAATMFFVAWAEYGIVRSLLLLPAALGWVLVSNAGRVFIITLAATQGRDLTEGWPHQILGMGVFVFTLFMVWSTDRLIAFFISGLPAEWTWGRHRGRLQRTLWPMLADTSLGNLVGKLAAVGFVMLLVVQLVLLAPVGGVQANLATADAPPPSAFSMLQRESLPAAWGARPSTGFGSTVDKVFRAVHSRFWTYGPETSRLYASLDFPFPKWHDLGTCYRGLGWTLTSQKFVPPESAGELPLIAIEMAQAPLRYGYLVYFLVDDAGEPMPFEKQAAFAQWLERSSLRAKHMRANWQAAGERIVGDDGAQYTQLQVALVSLAEVTDAERAEARQLLQRMATELREHWIPAARAAAPSNTPPSESQ